jgi:hypothetical protein
MSSTAALYAVASRIGSLPLFTTKTRLRSAYVYGIQLKPIKSVGSSLLINTTSLVFTSRHLGLFSAIQAKYHTLVTNEPQGHLLHL